MDSIIIDIPKWLDERPSRVTKPPILTRIEILPLQELTWEDFERLVYRLARKNFRVYECRYYGDKGQNQKGIDIIAYPGDAKNTRPIVFQCKRISKILCSDITNFVDRFLDEKWDSLPEKFVLCFSRQIRETHLLDQIEREKRKLAKNDIILSIWDQAEISILLKDHLDIVDDFFGEEWMKAFIGSSNFLSLAHLKDIYFNKKEIDDLKYYHDILYNKNHKLDLPPNSHSLLNEDNKIKLDRIYIDLETRERVATCEDRSGVAHRILQKDIEDSNIQCVDNWKLVPMSLMEALKFYNKVLIIGGRGSGKSTAIRYLVSCLTAFFKDDQISWMEKLAAHGWTHGFLIPILIPLEEFSQSSKFGPNANAIWDFFSEEFRIVGNSIEPIKKALRKGKVIILLDDLHKVPKEKRPITINAILDLVEFYPLCRYVITCRDSIFSKENLALINFRPVILATLTPIKINKFIENLYNELRNIDWTIPLGKEDDLKNAIYNSELIQLAENPLSLTQMAILHTYGKLPDDRVDILSETLKIFLNNKDAEMSFIKPSDLENALYQVAYTMYFDEQKASLGMEKSDIINIIQNYVDEDIKKATKLFEYVESTLNILTLKSNLITFSIKYLHEYMVSCYLQKQKDFISNGVDLTKSDPSKWHNIFAMAARLAGPDIGISAIRSMCPLEPPSKVEDIRGKPDWDSVWMAAEALSEIGLKDSTKRQERIEVLNRIRQWLVLLIEASALTPIERHNISKILSKLGDTRQGVLTTEPNLIKIPNGEVILGGDRLTNVKSYAFNIPYDYYVSKYLVTNAQYAMFLSDNDNYPLPEDEGNVWKNSTRLPNPQFLNLPVVGVSWDDARYYCQWLTEKFRNSAIIPKNYIFRLPTDVEWIKMYRGGKHLLDGTENPFPTRQYPWGDKWIDGYANEPRKNGSLDHITAVGIYPNGRTPYGILDACGNVLEWTSTSWGSFDIEVPRFSHPYNALDGRESSDAEGLRIVRGGSWLFSEGEAKCACRLHQSNKFPDTGFRVFMGPKDLIGAFSSNKPLNKG